MAKKILLADDSLTIQKVVELTFSDSDYELFSVSNGQKALDRVREFRPDLILADAVMPEKNGYEVCEAIKRDPATSGIPVILLSGTFEPFDR
ncbi:MAG TPA: response regulator, partial [Thermoanaerobaculia bacterium]